MNNSKTIIYGSGEKAFDLAKQNPQYEFIEQPAPHAIAPRITAITYSTVGFSNDPNDPPRDEVFHFYDILMVEHGSRVKSLVFPTAKVDGFDVYVRSQ